MAAEQEQKTALHESPEEQEQNVGLDDSTNEHEHDPHYEPIVSLPEVCLKTMEEDEVEMIKMRAKLYRYDKNESPPEWKVRGTGDVKLLRHSTKNTVRVVMRRDKTLKLCANHYVTPWMELKPSHGSDRSWVYSVDAEFSDGEVKQEVLAIMFANSENAKKWKEKFEEAKAVVESHLNKSSDGNDSNSLIELSADEKEENGDDSVNTSEEEEAKVKQPHAVEDETLNKKLEELNVEEKETEN